MERVYPAKRRGVFQKAEAGRGLLPGCMTTYSATEEEHKAAIRAGQYPAGTKIIFGDETIVVAEGG